ncbi:hypothetical protein RKD28_004874 [Streptomyces sp. SAI-229]|jgi:hypothetical protein
MLLCLKTVVELAGEAVEQMALGGGVTVFGWPAAVDVLKVAHHGSTYQDSDLIAGRSHAWR